MAAFLLRAYSLGLSTINWDEGVYFVTAQQWLLGHLPYLTVWDQHPVGLPAVVAASGYLAGDIPFGARVAAVLATGLTAAILVRFCQFFLNSGVAGAVAATLYLIGMSQEFAMAVQTEVFNNLLISLAAYLLLREVMGRTWFFRDNLLRLAVAGLLFGVALQIKYVAVGEAVVLCLGYLVAAFGKDRSIFRGAVRSAVLMAGGLLPTLVVMGVYWHAGAFEEFWRANLTANFSYMKLVPEVDDTLVMIRRGLQPMAGLGLGLILLAVVARKRFRRYEDNIFLGLMVLWLAGASIDVCLPMKFWDHYFEMLLPPLSLCSAFALLVLWRLCSRQKVVAVGSAFLIVLIPALVPALTFQNWMAIRHFEDVPRLVARDILYSGSNGRDVYVFDYEPVVYYLTGTMPLTRYVLPAELTGYSTSSGVNPTGELDAVLAQNPRYIVTATPGPSLMGPDMQNRMDEHLKGYRVLSEHAEILAGANKVTIYIRL